VSNGTPGRPAHQSETQHDGGVPQIDPEQLAALRRLKSAFGDVEILEIIDHMPVWPAQGWLFDEQGDDDEGGADDLAH
jgi:hypothetical protein